MNPKETNTEKWGCRELARALAAYGVREAVTSPGSRNTPLLMAISRNGAFRVHSVIDERSAAFIALGIAEVSGKPVALVCTSGTAMLNYAPAIAEAYYRHIPLIAVTADRPACWIGQDDSQTMCQPGSLANITVRSCNIVGERETSLEKWEVNRSLNDVLLSATTGKRGPVHINVQLDTPLTVETDINHDEPFRKVGLLEASQSLSTELARETAREIHEKRILVVGGFNAPSGRLNRALGTLSQLSNAVVLYEGLANIHARGCIQFCDADIRPLNDDSMLNGGGLWLRPDVLITFGGALVSAQMKRFLRDMHPQEHWHVGENDATIDCYQSLTLRVEISPEGFFPRLANALAHLQRVDSFKSDYGKLWSDFILAGRTKRGKRHLPWSAMKAIKEIVAAIPKGWNLQVSNGMTVRQALQCDLSKVHRTDCNRGVSGIDGSVSTAVGASYVHASPTVLITGDMSMQYDIGALASTLVTDRLRIVVINNGGGGIFHYVRGTAHLPEMPALLNGTLRLPLRQLAEAYGFCYALATGTEKLRQAICLLTSESVSPIIIEVKAEADVDAGLL